MSDFVKTGFDWLRRIGGWWKSRKAKKRLFGARAVFKLNGAIIPYAKGVLGEEAVYYEPVDILDCLKEEEMEFVPGNYRANLAGKVIKGGSFVQELDEVVCDIGVALRIKVRRYDDKPMGWREVWEAFRDRYPGQWAIQVFPPEECLMDEANVYHLFVFYTPMPDSLNLNRR